MEPPPLVILKELKTLLKVPGDIKGNKGQRVRKLYSEGSINFWPPRDLSEFGLCCFICNLERVEEICREGQVDLAGTETAYKWGYVSIVAFASQRDVKRAGSSETPPYAELIEFLISRGAPVDVPDIVGLTALHHIAMNNKDEKVIKVLLNNGANPNAKDRYGCLPLHGAIMNNQIEATDLCLQYGANLDIGDADGVTPRSLLSTYASPGMRAVVQKNLRRSAGFTAPLEHKHICAACGKEKATTQCSRCRVVRYCDSQCQRQHWRNGHKNTCAPFEDPENTVIFIPTYDEYISSISHEAIVEPFRYALTGQTDGEGSRPSNQKKLPLTRTSTPFASVPVGKTMIIKAQLPAIMNNSRIAIYNKNREFQCAIDPERQLDGSAYERLKNAIREKGTMGMKAYFTSEVDQGGRLKIKVNDVLAEQPW